MACVEGRNQLGLPTKEDDMGLVLVLLILALLLGGVGLFVEALRWLLIIALVLLVVGAFTGYRARGRV
jgi:hypothetical protein